MVVRLPLYAWLPVMVGLPVMVVRPPDVRVDCIYP